MNPFGAITMAQPGGDGVSQQVPAVLYDGTITEAGNFTTVPVFVADSMLYSVQLSCPSTGSPVGTVKLQASNDQARIETRTPGAELANWVDLTFQDSTGAFVTTQAVSGASTISFQETSCSYRWVRAVYTRTSGSITPTLKLQAKGMS